MITIGLIKVLILIWFMASNIFNGSDASYYSDDLDEDHFKK